MQTTLPLSVLLQICDPLHGMRTVKSVPLFPPVWESTSPPTIQPPSLLPEPPTLDRMNQALGNTDQPYSSLSGKEWVLTDSVSLFSFRHPTSCPEFLLFFLLEFPSSSSFLQVELMIWGLEGSHCNIPGLGNQCLWAFYRTAGWNKLTERLLGITSTHTVWVGEGRPGLEHLKTPFSAQKRQNKISKLV